MTSVASRAHRILKSMVNYHDVSEAGDWLRKLPHFTSINAEVPIGIYLNEPDGARDTILISTVGMYLQDGSTWKRMPYTDIVRVVSPESKSNPGGLSLHMRDGSEHWLPVNGAKAERFYDAFEVLRFVDRVIEDLQRSSS